MIRATPPLLRDLNERTVLEAILVREATERPDGPGYGAVYFEPVAEAALVLGLDVGARFVRGALCDLAGAIRARQDVELPLAVVPEAVAAAERLRTSLFAASGLDPHRLDGVLGGG